MKKKEVQSKRKTSLRSILSLGLMSFYLVAQPNELLASSSGVDISNPIVSWMN